VLLGLVSHFPPPAAILRAVPSPTWRGAGHDPPEPSGPRTGSVVRVEGVFHLATETFIGGTDVEKIAAGWRNHLTSAPQDAPYYRRGAYRGALYLGGYVMQGLVMRLGAARLRTCPRCSRRCSPSGRRAGDAGVRAGMRGSRSR
jgi:hypothetical protein